MTTDELSEYLDSLQREDCYRVERTLKSSDLETTQVVSFVGSNGSTTGPYIRKYIKQDAGMGGVYERLHAAQREGGRFKGLPAVLECYRHDDELVVVMEYLPGETLESAVHRCKPSLELAADVFPRLCDAVSELHEDFDPPIIHRDLKPSNVILSSKGLSVIDFGIAREYKEGADTDTSHFGTRAFAPPEQFGFGQTTVRSDVYALGMILFFCLTGVTPSAAAREGGFADPRIPEPVRAVIRQATELDPKERFASCAEMKRSFLGALPWRAPAERPDPAAPPKTAPPKAAFSPAAPRSGGPNPWGFRNVAAVVVTAILLASDVTALFNPTPRNASYPLLYNILTFGPFGISFFVAFGYTLLDKKRLAERYPLFGKLKSAHLWAACGLIFLVCTTIIAASGITS